jgi:predicted DNA binding CopG/RHH family protein
MKLDPYEQEIEDAFDMSALRDPDAALLKMLKEAARNSLRKDQRLGIRLTKRDLAGIKEVAAAKPAFQPERVGS